MAANAVRVLQTNSAGDNIHVIDPATNQVVGVIEDIEVPHGAAIAPDGSRIYVSDEALKTLDVVDARSLKVIKRIPLERPPEQRRCRQRMAPMSTSGSGNLRAPSTSSIQHRSRT